MDDKIDVRFAEFEQRMDRRRNDHMTELEAYYNNHYSEIMTELRTLRDDYQKNVGNLATCLSGLRLVLKRALRPLFDCELHT